MEHRLNAYFCEFQGNNVPFVTRACCTFNIYSIWENRISRFIQSRQVIFDEASNEEKDYSVRANDVKGRITDGDI